MTALWDQYIQQAIHLRRELHKQPELTWQEEATAARIRAELTSLNIPWESCAQYGTLGRLATDKPGPHIALRGDIDALPINEKSGMPWSSEKQGCMHACGHDGHTATLMMAAYWLKAHEDQLPGPVTLLFQPAEEGGHGALRMIEEGALKGIDMIYGWHNWPAIPYGQAVCPEGPVMAGNGTFKLTVTGQGGHSSQPEVCRDPVLSASAIVVALQQIVSRRLPPQDSTVLSVTSIDGRSSPTVIPDEVIIEGGFRIAQPANRQRLANLIEEIAGATARAYGTQCHVEMFPRYDATINHAKQAAHYRDALEQEFGDQVISQTTPLPIMASEDFSYYLKEIPGAFALIGSDDGQLQHSRPCHNAQYDFNDALINRVARVYARLVGAPVPDSP
ncbi:N(2)-acetyl-L-2,4-diaminobutanoate deacetylase DoeB2 [Nitrincola schmidtii]|uniref:N(2)-acetyl-L-2,4-diaminobutanoate deacetylase DoeB2 n=1 Tax=Nitrincola schmidtii TaxID=1730894 RepID=UPI00124D594A|nr:N(2)-acetyl-L-2,4-diaminobutanoate deacetylase DoeB2 [Nitrincola schmidtii]